MLCLKAKWISHAHVSAAALFWPNLLISPLLKNTFEKGPKLSDSAEGPGTHWLVWRPFGYFIGPQAALTRGKIRGHPFRPCLAGPPPLILMSKYISKPPLPVMQHERGHNHYRRLPQQTTTTSLAIFYSSIPLPSSSYQSYQPYPAPPNSLLWILPLRAWRKWPWIAGLLWQQKYKSNETLWPSGSLCLIATLTAQGFHLSEFVKVGFKILSTLGCIKKTNKFFMKSKPTFKFCIWTKLTQNTEGQRAECWGYEALQQSNFERFQNPMLINTCPLLQFRWFYSHMQV